MKQIQSSGASGAIGPYSQGFMTNGLIFTSGQLPADPATGEIPEGITAQTEQSCKNVLAILDAAGSGTEKVVKTMCFLLKSQTSALLMRCTQSTLYQNLPEAALP